MKVSVRVFLLAILPAFMLGCNDDSGPAQPISGPPAPRPPAGSAVPPTAVTLGNLVRTQDVSGHIRIMGSATNSADATLNFIQVKCTFKDAAGATVGTDQTYIVSSVVRMSSTGAYTNTALNRGGVGYFDVQSTRSNAEIASYTCEPSFSTGASTPPAAKMEIVGEPSVVSDFNGRIVISGTVKNSGTSPLASGEVFSVVFDGSGALLDINSRAIKGRTATLPSGGTTTSALGVDESGTFTLNTFARYTSYDDIKYLFDWSDVSSLAATLALDLPSADEEALTDAERHARRNARIDEMRASAEGG